MSHNGLSICRHQRGFRHRFSILWQEVGITRSTKGVSVGKCRTHFGHSMAKVRQDLKKVLRFFSNGIMFLCRGIVYIGGLQLTYLVNVLVQSWILLSTNALMSITTQAILSTVRVQRRCTD